MGRTKKEPEKRDGKKRKLAPATSPERQESRMISLAMDLAEKQLQEGTASAMVIAHFLKQGSIKEQYERELLKEKTEMMAAKTEMLKSAKRIEELYSNALKAMRTYSGQEDPSDDSDL